MINMKSIFRIKSKSFQNIIKHIKTNFKFNNFIYIILNL